MALTEYNWLYFSSQDLLVVKTNKEQSYLGCENKQRAKFSWLSKQRPDSNMKEICLARTVGSGKIDVKEIICLQKGRGGFLDGFRHQQSKAQ